MTRLQFYSNVGNVAAALVTPGRIYNFVKGTWEDLPVSGVPTKDHLKRGSAFAPVGPLKFAWQIEFPVDPADAIDSSAAVFSVDTNLTVLQVIDLYPYQYMEPVSVFRGGWTRS